MRDGANLNRSALYVYHEPLLRGRRDRFMQHPTARSEWWRQCTVWRRINELGADELAVLSAKCLTYGMALASNITQEISWAHMSIVVDLFDAEEACCSPSRQILGGAPTLLSAAVSRWLLGATLSALIYTDDGHLKVVGVERTVRLLQTWRRATVEFGLVMANPCKRHFGVAGTWLSARASPSGACYERDRASGNRAKRSRPLSPKICSPLSGNSDVTWTFAKK